MKPIKRGQAKFGTGSTVNSSDVLLSQLRSWSMLLGYRWWLGELEKNEGGIEQFAEGYKIFGWNRDDEKGARDEEIPSS